MVFTINLGIYFPFFSKYVFMYTYALFNTLNLLFLTFFDFFFFTLILLGFFSFLQQLNYVVFVTLLTNFLLFYTNFNIFNFYAQIYFITLPYMNRCVFCLFVYSLCSRHSFTFPYVVVFFSRSSCKLKSQPFDLCDDCCDELLFKGDQSDVGEGP